MGERNGIRLLARVCLFPLVKIVDGDQTAAPFERITESRPGLDAFGLGVDVRESDLDVRGPIRDQAPAQQVEAALPGLLVIADDGQGVGRRYIPAGRKIGRRPFRRNPENEPDLAHIGGKAGAATHAVILARAEVWTQVRCLAGVGRAINLSNVKNLVNTGSAINLEFIGQRKGAT